MVDRLPEILNVGIQHSEGLLSSSLVNRVTGLRCKKHFIPKRRNCDEKVVDKSELLRQGLGHLRKSLIL